ncbi:MAG: RNA polymerase sigma factor [Thermoleophilaceae bacterium]
MLALLRKRRAEATGEPVDGPDDRTSPELVLDAHEAIRLVGQLTPNQRLAMSLRVAGYSYRELADLTGQTYTWVNRHLTEGRRALRNLAQASE